jgi:hypothetical protein
MIKGIQTMLENYDFIKRQFTKPGTSDNPHRLVKIAEGSLSAMMTFRRDNVSNFARIELIPSADQKIVYAYVERF